MSAASASPFDLHPARFAAIGLPLDYVADAIVKLKSAGITQYPQLALLAQQPVVAAKVASASKIKANNLLTLAKAAHQILAELELPPTTEPLTVTTEEEAPLTVTTQFVVHQEVQVQVTELPISKPAPTPPPPAAQPADPLPAHLPPPVSAPLQQAVAATAAGAPDLHPDSFADLGMPVDYLAGVLPKLTEAGIRNMRQLAGIQHLGAMQLAQVAGKLRIKPNNLLALARAAGKLLHDNGNAPDDAANVATPAGPNAAAAKHKGSVFKSATGQGTFQPAAVVFGVPPTPAVLRAQLAQLPPPAAKKGHAAAQLSPVPLASGLHWAQLLPPVCNQRARRTSAAFALTAAHELYLLQRGRNEQLSEQHLDACGRRIGSDHGIDGASLGACALALSTTGQCRDATWPYADREGDWPLNARSEGSNFRTVIAAIDHRQPQAVEQMLRQGLLVAVCLQVHESWLADAAVNEGIIDMPAPHASVLGTHAVCVVGFQQDASQPGGGRFVVRNSWGAGWGCGHAAGAGHAWLPYAYLAQFGTEAYRIQA